MSKPELQEVQERLKAGELVEITPRKLLPWFGWQKRGAYVVQDVRGEIERAGLRLVPDLLDVGYDDPIQFKLASEEAGGEKAASTTPTLDPAQDSSFRVGTLPTARSGVVSVAPDATIEHATTLMMAHDYSQLPVMVGEHAVRGIFSWKTLGSTRSRGLKPSAVRECQSPTFKTVRVDQPVFETVRDIVQAEYVLVRDETSKVSGIVTTTDLSEVFQQRFEPFLLLGEIEDGLRAIIDGHLSLADIRAGRDPADTGRNVGSVHDLTFGEYVRLLQQPKNWSALPYQVDRQVFVAKLEQVNLIRNDVMHFSPDPLEGAQVELLRSLSRFVHSLR